MYINMLISQVYAYNGSIHAKIGPLKKKYSTSRKFCLCVCTLLLVIMISPFFIIFTLFIINNLTPADQYNPSGKPLDELPDWMAGEQREFEEKLDANKDGYLDNSEIRQWIAPNDDEFFNDEIDHLLNHIDDNKVHIKF